MDFTLKVLVVDDEDVLQRTLKRMFKGLYSVEMAGSVDARRSSQEVDGSSHVRVKRISCTAPLGEGVPVRAMAAEVEGEDRVSGLGELPGENAHPGPI